MAKLKDISKPTGIIFLLFEIMKTVLIRSSWIYTILTKLINYRYLKSNALKPNKSSNLISGNQEQFSDYNLNNML
jgi:hypothetical protein